MDPTDVQTMKNYVTIATNIQTFHEQSETCSGKGTI